MVAIYLGSKRSEKLPYKQQGFVVLEDKKRVCGQDSRSAQEKPI
jgi:hypothetical protein